MRQLPAGAQTALEQRNVTIRDFLWIAPRHRDTGAVAPAGLSYSPFVGQDLA